MSKQELINLCEKHIEDIEEKIKELDSDNEYKYYESFFKLYGIKTLKGISKIKPIDVAPGLLHTRIKDKSFSEIEEDINSFRYVLEKFNREELHELNYTMGVIGTIDLEDDLIERLLYLDENTLVVVAPYLNSEEQEVVNSTLKKLMRLYKEKTTNIVMLFTYYRNYPRIMDEVVEFIEFIYDLKQYYSGGGITICDEKSDKKITLAGNILSGKIDKYAKKLFRYEEIYSEFAPIEEHYNKLLSEHKTELRGLTKNKKVYTEFISKLQKGFKPGEIKDYEDMIKNIPDEDVKVEFLKLVYEHNMKEFKNTKTTYDNVIENSPNRFIVLLNNNGISEEEVQIDSIMKNSYEDVVKMLKILRGMFNDKSIIIKGLETAKLVDILYLKELMDKGVLSKDSIVTNTSLFDSESHIRSVLNININVLNEFGFNPATFGLSQGLLLGCESLKNSLSVLKEYDLIKYIKGQKDYSFIGDSNLTTKIDKFLELGYEGLVKEDITLLNEDNIDRVYVLKSVGVMPESKEELLDCLRSDKFLISDDKREEYINNAVSSIVTDFKLDIDSIISDYDNTSRTICINGVILSKNRIRRNGNLGSFKSIITGSILSYDEVDSLKSELGKKEIIKNS